MPRPVYMLCSESGSEDKRTGLFSHFKVLEQFQLARIDIKPGQIVVVPAVQLQAVALWAKEDADEGREFEYQFSLVIPDGERVVLTSGSQALQARLWRLICDAGGALFKTAGDFRVECRIRPVGSDDDAWMTQSYPLQVVDASAGAD